MHNILWLLQQLHEALKRICKHFSESHTESRVESIVESVDSLDGSSFVVSSQK